MRWMNVVRLPQTTAACRQTPLRKGFRRRCSYGGRDGKSGRLGQPSLPTTGFHSGGKSFKHAFLRNEAICNVEEMASILFGENALHRLRKNDKWVRFSS